MVAPPARIPPPSRQLSSKTPPPCGTNLSSCRIPPHAALVPREGRCRHWQAPVHSRFSGYLSSPSVSTVFARVAPNEQFRAWGTGVSPRPKRLTETMRAAQCRCCRCGIFPYQAGGQVRTSWGCKKTAHPVASERARPLQAQCGGNATERWKRLGGVWGFTKLS